MQAWHPPWEPPELRVMLQMPAQVGSEVRGEDVVKGGHPAAATTAAAAAG